MRWKPPRSNFEILNLFQIQVTGSSGDSMMHQTRVTTLLAFLKEKTHIYIARRLAEPM
jgi:hypothetical protein